jgi:hypothetical protein
MRRTGARFARHSRRDAEAYDRYSRDILRHCRLIRPMLMRRPPDPASFRPRDLMPNWPGWASRCSASPKAQMYDMIRFWTMSIADFWTNISKARWSRPIRRSGRSSARPWGRCRRGRPMCCLHHAMGDVDGNVGAWGYCARRHGRDHQGADRSAAGSGGRDRHRVGRRAGAGAERARGWGGAWRTATNTGRRVISNMDVRRTFLKHMLRKRTCRAISCNGSSGSRRAARQRQAEHRAGWLA